MSSSTLSRRALLARVADPLAKGTGQVCYSADPAPEPTLEYHYASRLTFGPKPGDEDAIRSQGIEAWLDQQLNPASINDNACDQILTQANLSTLNESWAQLYDRRSMPWPEPIRPMEEARSATWIRAVNSRRQLYERVVNFWHDHFNVFGGQFIVRSLFPKWDDTIRQHALGNFREFLGATARHPVMLYYLDNYVNKVEGPNENYARELYELHTLGVENYRPDIVDEITCNATNDQDGDGLRDYYIDNDVYESARCFTGWSFETGNDAPNRGQFVYRPEDHDRFNKFFLCQYNPPDLDSMVDGERVLDVLASHPGTARHIAGKLCRRFVSDNPPQTIIDSTAQVFLDNASAPDQIARTLRHLFLSAEFQAARLAKFKRPFEWMASAMRTLGVPYVNNEDYNFSWRYNPLGHPLFEWPAPDGAPDDEAYWATSNGFLRRWNLVQNIASNYWDDEGFFFVAEGITPPGAKAPRDFATFWANRIICRPLSGPTAEALLRFADAGRNPDLPLSDEDINDKVRYLAALCTMSPEFMRM